MANVSSFSGAMPVIPGGTVELGYTERTTDFSTTQTAFSTTAANNVFASDLSVVCDGSPMLVEFYARLTSNSSSTAYAQFSLNLDGADNARCATNYGTTNDSYVYFQRRVTPAAGVHTFNVCPHSSAANTITVYAGAGGAGNAAPMFLRVSKIVNQNDGLKPFWTPPVVTSLPSQATVGDQVIYAADATNGVYWHLQYDGLGTYPWKFIGGNAYESLVATSEGTTTTASLTDLATVGPSYTVVLPGDYTCTYRTMAENNTSGSYAGIGLFNNGSLITSGDPYVRMGSASMSVPVHWTARTTVTTSGHVLKMVYKAIVSGTASFEKRGLYVTPIRVKAA